MKVKTITFFLLLLLSLSCEVKSARNFQDEKLNYVISYKWGLIHKDAGEATLSLKKKNDNYHVSLTARTKPWADMIFKVRDTLKTVISPTDLKPLSYTKISNEKGKYKRDEIVYNYSGNVVKGAVRRYKGKGKNQEIKNNSFEASGPVFDMLSVFYYIRSLDFASMKKDRTYSATIFSGKKMETVRIRYLGIENLPVKNKSDIKAYHVRFNFMDKNGSKSSDDMDTWISLDSSHVPLFLTGKLPIGKIRATLLR